MINSDGGGGCCGANGVEVVARVRDVVRAGVPRVVVVVVTLLSVVLVK